MKNIDINLKIEDSRWSQAMPNLEKVVEPAAHATLSEVRFDCTFLNLPVDFSINLCLSDDAHIQTLNKQFRNIDAPTNVLSFANIDQDDFFMQLKTETTVELGDIIIAFETMQRQADELGISLHDHFCHLWVHGLLHILGFDHQTPDEADEMEGIESVVLEDMGIESPYQDEE